MLGAILAVALAACILISAIAGALGVGDVDPTEQTMRVYILNDSPQDVTVETCLSLPSPCDPRDAYPHSLKPGETALAATSDRGVPNWHRITDSSGRVLGCLPLLFTTHQDGAIVKVSGAEPCPH